MSCGVKPLLACCRFCQKHDKSMLLMEVAHLCSAKLHLADPGLQDGVDRRVVPGAQLAVCVSSEEGITCRVYNLRIEQCFHDPAQNLIHALIDRKSTQRWQTGGAVNMLH